MVFHQCAKIITERDLDPVVQSALSWERARGRRYSPATQRPYSPRTERPATNGGPFCFHAKRIDELAATGGEHKSPPTIHAAAINVTTAHPACRSTRLSKWNFFSVFRLSLVRCSARGHPRKLMPAYSAIERAFQVARSGECQTLDDIRALLKREGYSNATEHTSFPVVRRQLNDLMQGRAPSPPPKAERRRKRAVVGLTFQNT